MCSRIWIVVISVICSFLTSEAQNKGDSVVIRQADSLYNLTYDIVLSGASIDSAKHVVDFGLRLAEAKEDSISFALMLKAKSFWLYFQQRHEEGAEIAEQAMEIVKRRNVFGLGKYYHGIATHLERQAKWDEALVYYLKGLEESIRQNDSSSMVPIYHGIMLNYRTKEDFQKAIDFGKKGIEISKRWAIERLPNIANDLIYSFNALNKYDSALLYARIAESHLDRERNAFVYSSLMLQMGRIYMAKELYNEAMDRMKESEQIASKAGWSNQQGYAMAQQTQILLIQGRYQACINKIEEIRKLSIDQGLRRDLDRLASIAYESMGNHKEALALYKRFKVNDDTLKSQMYNASVSEMEVKFETAEKEAQLQERDNKILILERNEAVSKQRLIMIIAIVIVVILIGFFISRLALLKKEQKSRELKKIGQFKESMTGMIAHDLKTPLSIIMNSDESPTTKTMARQMLQLINNMLDVHRLESTEVKLNLEKQSLQGLIKESKEYIDFLLNEKDIQLEVRSTGNHEVLVDKIFMLRVLINLLTNAIKYSPFNETISIDVHSVENQVIVKVINKGQMIPKDQIETIFKSFVQLNPKDSGGIGSSGLGLTFVKLALEAHGSKINVDSNQNNETIFSFQLPSAYSDLNVSDESKMEQQTISGKSKELIDEKVNMLRSLGIHQIGEIEKELQSVKGQNMEVDKWVEEVLISVYSGNKNKYEKLLDAVNG